MVHDFICNSSPIQNTANVIIVFIITIYSKSRFANIVDIVFFNPCCHGGN